MSKLKRSAYFLLWSKRSSQAPSNARAFWTRCLGAERKPPWNNHPTVRGYEPMLTYINRYQNWDLIHGNRNSAESSWPGERMFRSPSTLSFFKCNWVFVGNPQGPADALSQRQWARTCWNHKRNIKNLHIFVWDLLQWGVSHYGWYVAENPIEVDDLGTALI